MADFIQFLDERKVLWSVENPENSMLWSLPCVQNVLRLGTMVQFDACCFGGERKTLRTSLPFEAWPSAAMGATLTNRGAGCIGGHAEAAVSHGGACVARLY